MEKATVDPAAEIYDVAQQDMKVELEKMNRELKSAKEDAFAMGVLKKIEYDNAHNEFLEYAVLHNIKQGKEYKTRGMTWKQFCEALGKSVRTIDNTLADISPLVQKFSASFADLSGIKFSKIRYLGRSISANSAEITENGIKIGEDEIIPIDPDHKDDIEAYIDSLKKAEAEAQKEKKETVKAKERVVEALHQTIADQERNLARYVKEAPPGELPDADKDQLKGIQELRNQIDLFASGIDIDLNLYLYNASEKVKAEYFTTLVYAKQRIDELWDKAGGEIGFPSLPGTALDDWEPSACDPEPLDK